jgi:ribosome biogenesis GTPase A
MSSINEINWFPGHMKKAIDNVVKKLQQCDGVIEIGDSRAPFSSFPDYLDKITKDKLKIYVFSKADLADPILLEKQLEEYRKKGIIPFAIDLRNPNSSKEMLKYLSQVKTKQDEKYQKLGFPLPNKTFMVLGIPNVGKSTFINSLAKKKKAAVENRPGKTRAQQLIKVSDKVYIYDVPGILEPNYENKETIAKLALLGSIKMEILPLIPLTDYLLDILKERYPQLLIDRYQVDLSLDNASIFNAIAINRKYMNSGNNVDDERARITLLKEFRDGTIGKISLDD